MLFPQGCKKLVCGNVRMGDKKEIRLGIRYDKAQRLKTLWDMNQPRVFVMELPGQAVIEGSASSWYPLDGLESSSAT